MPKKAKTFRSKFATKFPKTIHKTKDELGLQECEYRRWLAIRDHGQFGREIGARHLSSQIEIPGPSIEQWKAWGEYAKSPKGERSTAPWSGRKINDVVRQRPDQPNIASPHGPVAYVWCSGGLICVQVYSLESNQSPYDIASFNTEKSVVSFVHRSFAEIIKKKQFHAVAVVTWKSWDVRRRLEREIDSDLPCVVRRNKVGFVVDADQLEKAKLIHGATVSRNSLEEWGYFEPETRVAA